MIEHISMFQALADPSRVRIIEQIGANELAVSEIVDRLDIRQSGVSRHLKILEGAGIVEMRPVGQRRLYSLRRTAFDELEQWVRAYRRHWDARLDRLDDALARRQATAVGRQGEADSEEIIE